jgi:hypothetical protein
MYVCSRRCLSGISHPATYVQIWDIPRTADERTMLASYLEWQRDTLARKCAGLNAD